jgi:hypothetical protein
MKSVECVPCPHCGGEMSPKAKACPHCGSDESTGWSENRYLDGIDLPEEDEYEEIRQNEFEGEKKKLTSRRWILVTAAVVLVLFLLGIISVLNH